jgi:Tfp pilus assembly protein PilO
LVYPQYQKLIFKKEIISKKEQEFKLYDDYVKNLKENSQKLEQYQKELSKIDQALPTAPYLPEILSYLTLNSGANGLLVKKFSFSITEPKKETEKLPSKTPSLPLFKEIKILLSLTGSYEGLKNFLSSLEKSARLFEVEKISLSLTKEGLFVFDLAIKIYSY